MNARKVFSLLLSAALLLSGCTSQSAVSTGETSTPPASSQQLQPGSSQNPPSDTFSPTVYQLYPEQGDAPLLLDAQGNPLPPDTPVLSPLANLAAGETAYYTCTKTQDTGRREEGYPVTQTLSRLYAPDGTLLRDWEEYSYHSAFGSLIIRSDPQQYLFKEGAYTALWNPATGETLLEDVLLAEPLSQNRFLLIDSSFSPIAIVDQRGALLSAPPADTYSYANAAYGGYLVAQTQDRQSVVLDDQFQPVLTAGSIDSTYYGLAGPYLTAQEEGKPMEIYQDPTQPPVYTLPTPESGLSYFDGQLAIVKTSASQDNTLFHLIRTRDGQVLAENFDYISFHSSRRTDTIIGLEVVSPSQVFLAHRGEEVQLLDRQGEVLAQTTIPGLEGVSILTPQCFSYYIPNRESPSPYWEGVLDQNLNILVPADRYTSLHLLPTSPGESLPRKLIYAEFISPQGGYRTDLLTLDGEPLLQNLCSVRAREGGIAAIQGFHYGLIDWDGNWITRHPIFTMQQED